MTGPETIGRRKRGWLWVQLFLAIGLLMVALASLLFGLCTATLSRNFGGSSSGTGLLVTIALVALVAGLVWLVGILMRVSGMRR